MNVDAMFAEIKCIKDVKYPILIAIDGIGGSGKSTLAAKLQTALDDAQVIGIDDFIIKEKLLEVSAEEVSFDRKRLEAQVLRPLSVGKVAKYQKLNWVQNMLEGPIELEATKYVIVEGISVLHPEISRYFDYKIWVDTPIDVAKERGRQRDAGNENEPHWVLWSANDEAYRAKYHPEQDADFVVQNK